MPPMAWGVLPLYVAAYVSWAFAEADGGPAAHLALEGRPWWWLHAFAGLTGVLTLLALGWFFRIAANGGDIKVLFTATKYLLLPCAIFPGVLAELALGPRAGHAVCLLLCAWLWTETLCHLVKVTARRMRPVVALKSHVDTAARILVPLQTVITEGETAFQSFPSGDAAGAMVYSYLLFLLGGGPWVWLCVGLSAFGRVYLHAHHVLDVLGGSAIAYFATNHVVAAFGLEGGEVGGLSVLHVTAAMVGFVAFHIGCHKLLKFEVPAEFHVKESIYGRKHE